MDHTDASLSPGLSQTQKTKDPPVQSNKSHSQHQLTINLHLTEKINT